MQIQQLRYLLVTAECTSLRAAAKRLFVSQSTLSEAIKDLEKETATTIFKRNSKGIYLTEEGAELLGYARQVVEQVDFMVSKYSGKREQELRFTVASQHYSLVVEAFGRFVETHAGEHCNFFLNETSTDQIIDAVREGRSEIGILYVSNYNARVMKRAFDSAGLTFVPLFTAHPHVYIRSTDPLAACSQIRPEQLIDLVRYEHEQGLFSSSYYSEEPLSNIPCSRRARFSDNGSLSRMLAAHGGYTIATGIYPSTPGLTSLPVKTSEYMQVGYISRASDSASNLCKAFLSELACGIAACGPAIEPSDHAHELLGASAGK
ncbi:LysR family transcriptional regulator [uncultured Senegalimassilia sp.]|uniref:LysR family transcriptional regulator n=1 Tax=uncultured Senegalimassilia sp. TaxID=1714350 RepID=UPI002629AAD6|nr:LysR family transcriptional regulator [uncultured Senegalimassilia sp.]